MGFMKNSAAWHARYQAQTPNEAVNHAVTIMEFGPHDRVSRRIVAQVLHYILTKGEVYGAGPAIAAPLGINYHSTVQSLNILREFGLIVGTRDKGVQRYVVDQKRLANPSRKRCVEIQKKQIKAKREARKADKPRGRCKCGCKPERWVDGVCLLCHTRECIANGTV